MQHQPAPTATGPAEARLRDATSHTWGLPVCLSLAAHLLLYGGYQVVRHSEVLPAPPRWFSAATPQQEPPKPFVTLLVTASGEAAPADTEPPAAMPADPAPLPPSPPPPSAPPKVVAQSAPPPQKPPLPTPPVAPPVPVSPPPAPPAPVALDPPPEPLSAKPVLNSPAESPAPVAVAAPQQGESAPVNAASETTLGAPASAASERAVGAGALAPAGGADGGAAALGREPGYQGPALHQPPNLARFYPQTARLKAITGATTLSLCLDAKGRVEAAQITRSHPPGVFEVAAQRVARTLRFHPATQAGRAVPSEFTLTIQWQLEP